MSSNRPSGPKTPGRNPRRGRPNPNATNNQGPVATPAPAAPARDINPTPKVPCRDFMRGRCPRGANCRFSHAASPADPNAGSSQNQPTRDLQSHVENAGPSHFPGLANDQFSVGGTNATPGQTHHFLKTYVEDSFRFRIPDQVYKFVDLLCNASSQNPNWTPEDGHNHLRELVKGNGILRLGDAIRFPAETDRPQAWSFQRGYIPIFTYLSSEWVVKSTMNSDVNALYGLIHNEIGVIRATLEKHMDRLMAARSFKAGVKPLSGKQVFKVIFVTIFEYLTRFKQATSTNPEVCDLVERMSHWFDDWVTGLRSAPFFDDECAAYEEDKKALVIDNIRRDKERIIRIIQRGQTRVIREEEHPAARRGLTMDGLLAGLQRNCDYDGPGERRELGPRHDNDHVEIEKIRVAPTHAELLCADDPYLPGNFFEAPHFHDPRSVERLLDIQFRLLREELTAPLRMACQFIVADLDKSNFATTQLSKIIQAGGGRYSESLKSRDSVIFSVFTNITFEPLSLNNRGTSVGVVFDSPPGKARSKKPEERVEYWEQVTKKRLMQDGLVALIWRDLAGTMDVYVGTVASAPRHLVDSARRSQDRLSLRVSFFDATAELRVVEALQTRRANYGTLVLIEAPVFYEGIRPFLEALKRHPERLPFSEYLRHQSREELSQIKVTPPLYSLTPGFSFELKDLFAPSAGVQSLSLTTTDPVSVTHAHNQLARASRLDPSQATAVIDALTKEVSLIQGPPGTGKSYTGLELIRVLIKNQISPILLVAYTNHALDHMLKGILDADITNNIIRIGSRFRVDERLASFTLDTAEKIHTKSKLDRSVGAAFREMKEMETDMTGLMEKITSRQVPHEHMEECILSTYPYHYEELFYNAPPWISALHAEANGDQEGEEWETVGQDRQDLSIVDFWATGRDLQFLETPTNDVAQAKSNHRDSGERTNRFNALADDGDPPEPSEDADIAARNRNYMLEFLYQHDQHTIPPIPNTTRPLEALQTDPNIWDMSLSERNTLYDVWHTAASESIRETQLRDFESLRQQHAGAMKAWEEIKDQTRVNVLRRSHIIGCTTTGAAKVVSLLSGVEPKVMVVEEAGQVLESHILASLVESVHQIVMIGDPLQLRPNVNNYKLATDNPFTGRIYKFDQSLMERLSSTGFPMTQLDVQRRMRPSISSLIKNTLYRGLKDHPSVLEYPDVRGMHKNVFFVSHTNREAGGGEDSVSKHNEYEVDMIYDLVLHLLKQGCYNQQGNIVILAAYLGQIPKIRQKLRDVVTTVIDERDAELLEQHGIDEGEITTVQEVKVSQHVLVRTLDNFQGEEGEIIILSLVRNSGTPFDGRLASLQYTGGRSPIGFLKSTNRTNVGLSRAKHGLYIFGNAPELANGSEMWASVLQELHGSGCIGRGFPISCQRHSNYMRWIEQPGRLKIFSPDGGCLEDCAAPLPCGHRCPYKCHSDDPKHIITKCHAPCLRLCPLMHPCDRECWECSKVLGDCQFPTHNVALPCGHNHPTAPCYLARIPEQIQCTAQVEKQLPFCEHRARMPCHQDPATYSCREKCGVAFSCCSKSCTANCGACQKLNSRPGAQLALISRTKHPKHPCGRVLFCGHMCKDECKEGHTCSGSCEDKCRQICFHGRCNRPCSTPCKPCMRPCAWMCRHIRCPSACGMACTRLPCDKKCPNLLSCGHSCPSVCGEPCAQQTCRICASDNTLDAIVDLVMQTSLRDLEDDGTLDSMTITLPCRHVFTVETLDGITHLGDFYEKDEGGRWVKPVIPEDSGEIRTRPVCPTCRGNIDSLRYGRVCKNSNLSILQHNVASNLSHRLSAAETSLVAAREGVNEAVSNMVMARTQGNASNALSPHARQEISDRLDLALVREVDRPTPTEVIEGLDGFHAFHKRDATAWKQAIANVLEPYRSARQVACHRDPALQAYEASLAQIYREELGHFGVHIFQGTPEEMEQNALHRARERIGQLPPRASYRFIVEALWITTDILMRLGIATSKACEEVRRRNPNSPVSAKWEGLTEFFLRRAIIDAETACRLATQSESWNKAVKCHVLVSRTQYELAAHQCQTAIDKGATSDPNEKAELIKMCRQGTAQLKELQVSVPRNYLRRWGSNEQTSKHAWIQTNFVQPLTVLLQSWGTLERSARGGTWYQEVSNEERMAILNALMQGAGNDRLWHTGHFYQCPNGHPYVIGECGGAMEMSTCPECGAQIGGSRHRSLQDNAHSNDFVNLARASGMEESGWTWGPNRGRR